MLLETSGERPLANVPKAVVKIVDVKCPDSGEGGTFLPENLNAMTERDELKFVIASRRDYEFARDFIQELPSSLGLGLSFFLRPFARMRPAAVAPSIAWSIRAIWRNGYWRTT